MLSEPVQMALITAIPVTIGAIATAWVTITQSNKKTVETAKHTNLLVGEVHQKVNGNLSAVTDELAAVRRENLDLREQLARLGSTRSADSVAGAGHG